MLVSVDGGLAAAAGDHTTKAVPERFWILSWGNPDRQLVPVAYCSWEEGVEEDLVGGVFLEEVLRASDSAVITPDKVVYVDVHDVVVDFMK